ncbi:MAG: MarR family transcriptional regulator [Chloroflexota bacterium]|nr:MarR family transcriptional regulator [Chloroflexota bacterium]
MIVHVTRTTSPTGADDRRAAVTGIMDELNGAVRLLRCAATGRMVKQGVSMTHLHVMWRLEESGELPMSRLAEFLDVSLSNATGLVDRMAERGLIERTRLDDDRRVVLVGLTPAARATLEEIQIMKRDLMHSVLGRLDGAQLARLHAALTDFRAAVRDEETAHPNRFGTEHPEQGHHDQPRQDDPHQAQRREYAPQ